MASKILANQAETARSHLDAIAEKGRRPSTPKSAREFVLDNRRVIRRIRSLGYEWKEIADVLSADGIRLSGTTIRSYLHERRRGGKMKRDRAPVTEIVKSGSESVTTRSPVVRNRLPVAIEAAAEPVMEESADPMVGAAPAMDALVGVGAPVTRQPGTGEPKETEDPKWIRGVARSLELIEAGHSPGMIIAQLMADGFGHTAQGMLRAAFREKHGPEVADEKMREAYPGTA